MTACRRGEQLIERIGPHGAWVLATVLVAVEVASVAARAIEDVLAPTDVFELALLALPLAGALVVNQQAINPVGWLLLCAGVSAVVGSQVRDDRLAAARGDSPSVALALVTDAAWPIGLPLVAGTLLLVFPDPRTPPVWRWPLRAGLAGVGLMEAGILTAPWRESDHSGLSNPLAIDSAIVSTAIAVGRALVLAAAIAGVVRLVLMRRRGDTTTRAQVRALLVVSAAALAAVIAGAAIAPVLGNPAWLQETLPVPIVIGFPAAVALAAARHRLFGFRVVLHRSALATIAMLSAAAVAFAIAAAIAGWFGPAPAPAFLLGAVATILAGGAAHAARRAARRRLGGAGSASVLARLPALAPPGEALAEWAALVRETLGAPAVELHLNGRIACDGDASGLPVERVAIGAGGDRRDHLVVAWRSPGERYDANEQRTIAGLAHLLGGAIEQARTAEDARRSRRALADSAATERERLRRDIHDQLGPRLAGIAYLLAAVDADPSGEQHLGRARAELGAAAEDARRIAHDLQPRPVEELGLGEAIREHALRWASASSVEVELEITPALEVSGPAATAVYAVALEAIANVERHSRASRCRIALQRDANAVRLTVSDDGVGIPAGVRPGVGLASMNRRAEELAGSLTIEQRGGTILHFEVPISG